MKNSIRKSLRNQMRNLLMLLVMFASYTFADILYSKINDTYTSSVSQVGLVEQLYILMTATSLAAVIRYIVIIFTEKAIGKNTKAKIIAPLIAVSITVIATATIEIAWYHTFGIVCSNTNLFIHFYYGSGLLFFTTDIVNFIEDALKENA